MVRWLAPGELLARVRRELWSGLFGKYSDKREIQAALPLPDDVSYAREPELWMDFVADLGDAFGPTYAMASLLARPELPLALGGGIPTTTRRGRLLVMGGDQVYPAASTDGYRDRTLGPYRAALPYTTEGEAPDLFAIPGNHDWYDGLTAFMRVFLRRQWVGGWRTRQSRSYFAVQLRRDWWLWGIDIQFDTYIDEPQFRYFDDVAGARLAPGDSVVLCSAVPSWVHANRGDEPEAFATLDYFERKTIRRRGAEVRLALSGDAHHYARYERLDGGAQRVTAGGGGAFLSATHHLPETLELPPAASQEVGKTTPPQRFTLQRTYPSKKESKRLSWGVLSLPFKNRTTAALIGVVHLLYAWMIQSVLRSETADGAHDLATAMAGASFGDLFLALLRSPLALILSALLVLGMRGFPKSKAPAKRAVGVVHGLLHVLLAVGTIAAVSGLLDRLDVEHGWFLVAFVPLVVVLGGLLGGWLLALYLLVADRFMRSNTNELFAAQRIRGYKNLLRIHFAADGAVTLYPVKVARTPRRWKLREGGGPDDPWFEPVDVPLSAELIEEPVRVTKVDG